MASKDPIVCAENGDVDYFKGAPRDVILNARSHDDFSALDTAVRATQLGCCKEICEKCPELLYHQNKLDGSSALMHAAWRGNTEMVKVLLDTASMAGLEQGTQGGGGTPTMLLRMISHSRRSSLHWAVDQKKSETANMLMEADPEGGLEYGPDENGETTLLMATNRQGDPIYVNIRKQIVKKLPSQSMMRSGEKNWTVLQLAASKGHLDLLMDIIKCCTRCAEIVDVENRNFLHLAAKFGHTEVIKHVLKFVDIDPSVLNGLDSYGNTPFHEAALSGNQIMTEVFLYHPKVFKYTVNAQRQKVLDAVTFDYDKTRAQVSGVRDRVNEKQLKDQSDFDLVVGALIAAVSFTAGITVPGGYISDGPDQGMAVLSKETAFETFVVSNTLGLVLSLYSVFSHFCARNLFDKTEIDLQVTIATCCTLSAVLAMVVAFISGSYAVLNISHRLAMTVTVICCTFFLFTFWAVWRMIRQYKQNVLLYVSKMWPSVVSHTSSGGLPTSNLPNSSAPTTAAP